MAGIVSSMDEHRRVFNQAMGRTVATAVRQACAGNVLLSARAEAPDTAASASLQPRPRRSPLQGGPFAALMPEMADSAAGQGVDIEYGQCVHARSVSCGGAQCPQRKLFTASRGPWCWSAQSASHAVHCLATVHPVGSEWVFLAALCDMPCCTPSR